MKEPIFYYKDGYAKCTAEDNMGRKFIGEAWCAEEDKDFESMIIGSTIAEMRAQIVAAKTYRDDLKIKLKALKQLYYSMKMSKQFNPKSYENIMLHRQIRLLENDLSIAKHQLAVLKLDLYEYINDKDFYHQRIRKMRAKNVDMHDDKQRPVSAK